MSATQFSVDLDDVRFALFDQLKVHEQLGSVAKYADFDHDTLSATLEEAARVAVEVLDPINAKGDQQGCRLDGEGNVTTPEGYKEAWNTFAENGWIGMSASQEHGGIGLPYPVSLACNEMFTGACMAFTMYPGLTVGAARVIAEFAPEGMRGFADRMFAGEWGGTMCLTESNAGTAVGDNRTKATPTDEGHYLLEGEKIYISGGDQDLTDNIVHLVLARTPGAPSGSKGISIFLVPKFLVNDDGSLGERNGAVVTGIEHKMGIKGSATCTLTLGAQSPCKGWLLGEEGQGLPIMFHLMNEARIGVGGQGQGIAAAAYNFALAYAKERIQGTRIEDMRDPDAERVAIVEHPDVRRMLMEMKVLTETMRSLMYRIGLYYDIAEDESREQSVRDFHQNRVDLLVPIVKSVCTDLGFDVAVTGVQVLGGYGYTGEYPVEQLVRDGKIMSIYEGTNGVQAMDLVGRKLRIKGGLLLMEWLKDAQDRVKAAGEDFPKEAAQLGKAIQQVGATAMHLGGLGAQGNMAGAMLQATPFQTLMGYVVLGLEALDQATAAKARIDAEGETPLLAGKLLNLQFYVGTFLPKAVATAKSIQSADESCLDERLFA